MLITLFNLTQPCISFVSRIVFVLKFWGRRVTFAENYWKLCKASQIGCCLCSGNLFLVDDANYNSGCCMIENLIKIGPDFIMLVKYSRIHARDHPPGSHPILTSLSTCMIRRPSNHV